MIDFVSVRNGSNSGILKFPLSLVGAMGNVALNVGMQRVGSGAIVESECEPGKLVTQVTGCGVTDKNTYTGTEVEIQKLWRVGLEAKRLLLVREAAREGGPVQHQDQNVVEHLNNTFGVSYVALLNSIGLPVLPAAMKAEWNDLAAAIELAMEASDPAKAFTELFS